jgi:XRE family transcriptional regulator, regulator of sulfur utilization
MDKKDKNKTLWNNTKEVIGMRIRNLREDKDLNQAQFGKVLGVSDRTIGRIERGEKLLDVEVASAISQFFNISCDELLRGEKPKYYQILNHTGLSENAVQYLNRKRLDKNHKNTHPLVQIINILLKDEVTADLLFSSLLIYAIKPIINISVKSPSILEKKYRFDLNLKEKATWAIVEEYLKSVCDTLRYKTSDSVYKVLEKDIDNAIKNMVKNNKLLQERIDRRVFEEDEQMTPEELAEDIKWERENRNKQ